MGKRGRFFSAIEVISVLAAVQAADGAAQRFEPISPAGEGEHSAASRIALARWTRRSAAD